MMHDSQAQQAVLELRGGGGFPHLILKIILNNNLSNNKKARLQFEKKLNLKHTIIYRI